jgi:hypothetical protein
VNEKFTTNHAGSKVADDFGLMSMLIARHLDGRPEPWQREGIRQAHAAGEFGRDAVRFLKGINWLPPDADEHNANRGGNP